MNKIITEEWSERFDKKFPQRIEGGSIFKYSLMNLSDIKSFIAETLLLQRKSLLEQLMDKMPMEGRTDGWNICLKECRLAVTSAFKK